jgi:hypothetical protein
VAGDYGCVALSWQDVYIFFFPWVGDDAYNQRSVAGTLAVLILIFDKTSVGAPGCIADGTIRRGF